MMHAKGGPTTKYDALLEVQSQLDQGRKLLALPLGSRFELANAERARGGWQLQNKKILARLFGDHADTARRLAATFGTSQLGARPSLVEEARAFQNQVLAQMVALERIAGMLGRLA